MLAYSCHTPGPKVWKVATVRSTHPTDSLHLRSPARSAATASCSSGLCFPEGHVRSSKDLQPHSRLVTIAEHTVKEPQLSVSLYEVGTGQGGGQHCSEAMMLPIFVACQISWALRAASPDLGRRPYAPPWQHEFHSSQCVPVPFVLFMRGCSQLYSTMSGVGAERRAAGRQPSHLFPAGRGKMGNTSRPSSAAQCGQGSAAWGHSLGVPRQDWAVDSHRFLGKGALWEDQPPALFRAGLRSTATQGPVRWELRRGRPGGLYWW